MRSHLAKSNEEFQYEVFDNLEAYAAEVGNEIGVEWMVIDQDRINKFAEATATTSGSIDGERTQREWACPPLPMALTLSLLASQVYKSLPSKA